MKEKQYRWYPRHTNGEPNLNPWWAVTYRRLHQWFRRTIYWKLHPKRYQELILEQARVAHPETITQVARKRLGELLWLLGDDTPYRYTKEQGERIGQEMLLLVEEVLVEEQAQRESSGSNGNERERRHEP